MVRPEAVALPAGGFHRARSEYALKTEVGGIRDANDAWVTGLGGDDPGWHRGQDGYKSFWDPDVMHGSDVFDDWDNAGEDFADMFMNTIFDSFAANPAGDARYNWTTTNMAEWIN